MGLEPPRVNGCVFTSASAIMWSENSEKCRNRAFDRRLVRVEPPVETAAGDLTAFREVVKHVARGGVDG